MADLKVNIIATDRASPSLNKVSQTVSNVAQQFGTLSASASKLSNQLGALIGVGGLAGVSVGLMALAANVDEVSSSIADWITGIDKVREAYDKLAPKLEAHLKQLQGIRNEAALVRLAGSARAAAEAGQTEKALADLQVQIDRRRGVLAELEAQRAKQRAADKSPLGGITLIDPRVEARIQETTTEIMKLEEQARVLRETAVLLGEKLTLEQSKEGKKNLEDLNRALEKLAEQNYKNMLQIQEAVDLEQKLFVDWAKDLLEISSETAKVQAEINELGLARLEKSLGTGVTEEAIESGLEKNAATAKKIIEEYREGIARDQAIWIKLQDQRAAVIDKQRQQWERMLDSIRDSAGQIFDAMLTKGEGVFSSLAKFAEGVFQTMLRNVFQNAVQGLFTTGAGILSRIGGGGGGGARLQESIVGAGTSGAASSGLGALFGGLLGGGGAAATGGMGAFLGPTAAATTTSTAGGVGGGLLGGLFGGGAAGAAGMAGTLAAGAATAGIAVAAVLATSYISGLFKAGENRRLQEQARRAGVIQGQQFAAPETQTRFGIAGGAGYAVETSLTGDIRGIGRVPTVVVNVENSMIDARHAREAGAVIGQEVSRQILQGGSYLADNISWAAS